MTLSTTARRSLAAAAITPLLLTGFAACGDDSGSGEGSGGSGGVGSGAGSSALGSNVLAGLEEGEEVSPDEFVDTVAAGLEESTTAEMTMRMTMGGQVATEAEGEVDYTTQPPSMAMTMGIGGAAGTEMEMRMVDGIVYMKMDELSGGKYWKVDPSDPNGPFGQMGLDKMLEQSDPVGSLEAMRDGIEKVTFEGSEDVDGRDLDHYELTMDPAAVLEQSGGELPGDAASAMPESVTYDLWLDEEDRFAVMEAEYEVMGQDVSMEMTLDDWGTDVTIEAPPADETTDMPDLGSMSGGGAGTTAG